VHDAVKAKVRPHTIFEYEASNVQRLVLSIVRQIRHMLCGMHTYVSQAHHKYSVAIADVPRETVIK
jgi:hypothetical protein